MTWGRSSNTKPNQAPSNNMPHSAWSQSSFRIPAEKLKRNTINIVVVSSWPMLVCIAFLPRHESTMGEWSPMLSMLCQVGAAESQTSATVFRLHRGRGCLFPQCVHVFQPVSCTLPSQFASLSGSVNLTCKSPCSFPQQVLTGQPQHVRNGCRVHRGELNY